MSGLIGGVRGVLADYGLWNADNMVAADAQDAAGTNSESLSQRVRARAADSHRRLVGSHSLLNRPRAEFHEILRSDAPVSVHASPRDLATIGSGQEITREVLQRRLATPEELRDWVEINDLVSIEFTPSGDIILRAVNPGWLGERKSTERTVSSFGRTLQYSIPGERLLREGRGDLFDSLSILWGMHTVSDLDLEMRIIGLENLDPAQKVIYAPVHGSIGEFAPLFTVAGLAGHSLGFVYKRDFITNPFFYRMLGKTMLASDRFAPINRAKRKEAWDTMDEIAARLADPANPFSVVIYPQGTRFNIRHDAQGRRQDGDIFAKQGELKGGAFYAAVMSGVPLAPVTVNGMGRVMPSGVHRVLTGQQTEFVIGQPLRIVLSDDEKQDERRVREAMGDMRSDTEKAYRAAYQAPLMEPAAVQQLSLELRLKKAKSDLQSGDRDVSLSRLTFVRNHATNLVDDRTPQQRNSSREALNQYLDFFYPAVQADRAEEVEWRNFWLSSHGVDREYFENLLNWMQETGELGGVLARGFQGLPRGLNRLFARLVNRP